MIEPIIQLKKMLGPKSNVDRKRGYIPEHQDP